MKQDEENEQQQEATEHLVELENTGGKDMNQPVVLPAIDEETAQGGALVIDDREDFKIDPPASCGEKMRDSILRVLDHPFFQVLGLIVIFLVIVDGAFFFFLLMGWQSLCRPRTDCNPRNWWYNFSIQVLNVLFTYMNLVSMPWRSSQFLHIAGWSCPKRNNAPGYNLYGIRVENDAWFHIPLRRRLWIVNLLLLNALTQFANQATRIKYYSFELQDVSPGNIWTNVFFASSFLCAGLAGAWQAYEVYLLRKAHVGKFGPGPMETVVTLYEHSVQNLRRDSTKEPTKNGDSSKFTTATTNSTETAIVVVTEKPVDTRLACVPDPTRERLQRLVAPMDRSNMRLWGM